MNIQKCTDIIDKYELHALCDAATKIPDHCAITFDIEINDSHFGGTSIVDAQLDIERLSSDDPLPNHLHPKYRVRSIPSEFLHSDRVNETLNTIIQSIEVNNETQNEINTIYDNFRSLLVSELDSFFPIVDGSKHKKIWKPGKPYWCDKLTEWWKIMHNKETSYYKFRGARRTKEHMRHEYKIALYNFDKLLRQQKRMYQRGQLLEIEEMNTKNPTEF